MSKQLERFHSLKPALDGALSVLHSFHYIYQSNILRRSSDMLSLEAIASLGFQQCTPVQASVIPLLLTHKDIVAEAVTGSGKTLAYVLPVIQKILQMRGPSQTAAIAAVIIVPTRELAVQVHKVVRDIITAMPSTSTDRLPEPLLVTGGAQSVKEQAKSLHTTQGFTIMVGTPGRLEELLLGQSSIANTTTSKKHKTKASRHLLPDLKTIEMVILDEADRLLDLGFSPVLTKLLAAFPKQRRTGCFSATMTDALLSDIVRVGMRNPVRVSVNVTERVPKTSDTVRQSALEQKRTPSSLNNMYTVCKAEQKTAELLRIIAQQHSEGSRKVLVYFSTCAAVDYFFQVFTGLPQLKEHMVCSLHGQQPPSRRSATFDRFTHATADRLALLLCTDVAARGLDLPDVDCVIQYDAPQDPKAFSHRCGRTARAGRKGSAIVILSQGREEEYVDFLRLRKIPLAPVLSPFEYELSEADVERLFDEMRSIVLTDRDLEEKAMKAFVSFVRSYSKHEASYIFRLSELNLASVAIAYGLLRLPRMPELAEQDLSKWKDAEVDWDNFAYADASREAKRRSDLASQKKVQKTRSRPKTTEAWSHKKDKRSEQSHKRKIGVLAPAEKETLPDAEEDPNIEAEILQDEREAKRAKKDRAASKPTMGVYDL